MSPLWSERALAHAAWVKAKELGLVHDDKGDKEPAKKPKSGRRTIRPRAHSYAL
jgi:hypothetical protein